MRNDLLKWVWLECSKGTAYVAPGAREIAFYDPVIVIAC